MKKPKRVRQKLEYDSSDEKSTSVSRTKDDEAIIQFRKRHGRIKKLDKTIDVRAVEAAIARSGGLLSRAAELLNVGLPTLRMFLKRYTFLRDCLYDARESNLDIAEQSLIDMVKQRNVTATIFFLKCLGKDRGYIEMPKPGGTADKPLYIRLMLPEVDGKRKAVKEVAVPALKPAPIRDKKLKEAIEAEVVE